MQVFLVNPSNVSFGIAVITPRWMFVLAAATPAKFGNAVPGRRNARADATSAQDPAGRHRRHQRPHGQRAARLRSRPRRARRRRHRHLRRHPRHAVSGRSPRSRARATPSSRGDGDLVWGQALDDAVAGKLQPHYHGGRVPGDAFVPARWDLLPAGQVHVGVGADRARLPEALLVLLGLAHRRPGAAHAQRRRRAAGNRRAAPPGLPIPRAGRRQLLSGRGEGSRDGRAPRGQDAPATNSRRCAPSASS